MKAVSIELDYDQIAVLNWKTNQVDIVNLPDPFPVSTYNDVEEWLCCPDGGGYDLGDIDWMSKKE
jgi:hypothetical protein